MFNVLVDIWKLCIWWYNARAHKHAHSCEKGAVNLRNWVKKKSNQFVLFSVLMLQFVSCVQFQMFYYIFEVWMLQKSNVTITYVQINSGNLLWIQPRNNLYVWVRLALALTLFYILYASISTVVILNSAILLFYFARSFHFHLFNLLFVFWVIRHNTFLWSFSLVLLFSI